MTIANGSGHKLHIYDLAPSPGICPYVQRSKIALKEKKLEYTTSYVEKADKTKDGFLDLFRSITSNPQHRGTVPVLIDGDTKIAESDIITEYLDYKYPDSGTKLFPTDPYKLALVRLFVNNYTTQVQPTGSQILSAATPEEYKEATTKFTEGLKILDTFLRTYGEDGDFLLGSNFSYAEAATLPFFYRANKVLEAHREVSIDQIIKDNELTSLQKWKQAGFARESVIDTLPGDDIILDRGTQLVKVPTKDLKVS